MQRSRDTDTSIRTKRIVQGRAEMPEETRQTGFMLSRACYTADQYPDGGSCGIATAGGSAAGRKAPVCRPPLATGSVRIQSVLVEARTDGRTDGRTHGTGISGFRRA